MNATTQIAAKYAAQWYPYPSALVGTDSAKRVRDEFANVIASAIEEAACNSHARLTAENKALREALVAVMQTGAIHGASQAELSIGASALAGTNTEDR